ncbi:MAG: tyrosine-type recombinase/integrase [Rubrobacteraceae bacterium]
MPGKGDGITKRSDGRFMGRAVVETPTGAKRKTVYGKTYDEVRQKLNKLRADADGGLVFDAGKLTVGEYLGAWLTDTVKGTVRESTFGSYSRTVNNYLIPGVGKVKLKNLKPMHLRKLYRETLESGRSTRTVQYMHTLIKKALKDAIRAELIPHNPAEAVDPPKLEREEMRPLSAEEVRKLLSAARKADDRLAAVWAVAVHTGMRPGEMLALTWADVDLDAKTVQVKRALSGGVVTEPKTKRSRRRIGLSTGAVDALRAHRKRQLEERMKRAGLWEDRNLVFPSTVGTHMSQRNLTRAFKVAAERAGLPETVRLYDLRHTCATLLLSRNVHPKYVQELLGHASIALTLDTYSHVIPGMDGGTGDAMDAALG